MKKFFFNTLAIAALVLTSVSLKAQPVVTEYFKMAEPFKIDLSVSKVKNAVMTKGVLDVDWNESKRILAVTYQLQSVRVEDVVRNIKEVAANNFSNGSVSMPLTTRNEKE